MLSTLHSLSPFYADPLDAASSRHKSERSGLAVRGEARYRLGRYLSRPRETNILWRFASTCSGRTFTPTEAKWQAEGKVGAALTKWREGEETWYSTLRHDPFSTVFQVEMVALLRAIRRVEKSKDRLVNLFSYYRLALEVLIGLRTYHPLAHEARRNISEIIAEDRAVRLFWVRAHAGIAHNELVEELASRVALSKTVVYYDKFPLSYAKKGIRVASLKE
ncbi:hypothetical protein EVAR_61623_1 [Eumeta japonica]|uniref:RNase H type-1 domain-containing protein n=1 Tax=Eumeta variegata TaxID=151549 RepID=A0A4C1ZLV5_EUMVA|nr:hypothetical protein EVAR_61623_1 [Eumeta japonica]